MVTSECGQTQYDGYTLVKVSKIHTTSQNWSWAETKSVLTNESSREPS